MKLTLHSARADQSGRHNDRNFDVTTASHIDPTLSDNNKYWTYNNDNTHSFRDIELAFYKKHFSKVLKEQKEKNLMTHHKYRNKKITLSHMHSAKYTSPEDVILQVGNRNEHITGEKLWEITLDYISEFNVRYGEHCKILNAALHVDEPNGTPHVHIRRVWTYTDENGIERVGQTKALEKLGFTPPNELKQETKYNHAKVVFSATDRELVKSIVREHGIDLEPDTGIKREHLPTAEYKAKEIEKETAVKEQQLSEITDRINKLEIVMEGLQKDIKRQHDVLSETQEASEKLLQMPIFDNQFEQELMELRRLKKEHQVKAYNERLNKYLKEAAEYMHSSFFKSTYIQNEVAPDMAKMRSFIKEMGLNEEYNRYKEDYKAVEKEFRVL